MPRDWLLETEIIKSGKSRTELANICGITAQQFSAVIKGTFNLSFEQKQCLGNAIGMDPDLIAQPTLLNSQYNSYQWNCNKWRPCKRCYPCINQRAIALLGEAPQKFTELGINRHVVIRYPFDPATDNAHQKLREGADGVVKHIHRFLRPYVRFNAIGRQSGIPHSHYCLQADKVRYLEEYTADIKYKSGAKFGCKNGGVIYSPYGLLSYLYYQNFVPTFLNPNPC